MAPESITDHRAQRALEFVWLDGHRRQLAYETLRGQCPCAHCRVARQTGTGEPPTAPDLQITDLRPVGSYGVQIVFSDGHDRGIYPWVVLRDWGTG